ncbi:aminopeptidase P N-terminal domain-containing protein [Vicingaceae bacterium]|nr:aminopeptidase P N-terminal domain-containing protein [Vicingaceae bacterium]
MFHKIKSIILLIALLCISIAYGQVDQVKIESDSYEYDQDLLSPEFHQSRRNSLRKLLPEGSAIVFFSSPERNRSNDVYYEYHQNPNFYYLTGLREPNAMIVIYKDSQEFSTFSNNEVLFMQERDAKTELWNGRKLGMERAKSRLKITSILPNYNFVDFNSKFDSLKAVYYEAPFEIELKDTATTNNLSGLYYHFTKKNPIQLKDKQRIEGLLMAQLRQVKTQEELRLLRKAIDITCEAQNQLMKEITDTMTEFQTEAIIEYVFKKNGAEYTGFPSIQGSGENSCILHYTSNRRPLIRGGLLVSDIGAEYHGYTADVTRTLPPTGKFNKEQTQIYELVLKAQSAGIDAAIEGANFWQPGIVATEIIAEGLLKFGIIQHKNDVRKYFMHGTSHYLGLDVHDVGTYIPLVSGNVITVEPGIYIAEGSDCDPKYWNIGVRIEDDILITPEGPENLSAASPRSIKEIETLMEK